MPKTPEISPEELQKWRTKFRTLSNSGRYAEAYRLAVKLKKKYPRELTFAYFEAVMTAEDDVNYTPAQVNKRFKLAAKKFRALLYRVRSMTDAQKKGIRNEYYWFSRQPLKQYRMGVAGVAKGDKSYYYCQGVGASQLARRYALAGKEALCLKWAKKSEKAWLGYFKVVPNWYNSYLYYATSLGLQGKTAEMNAALETGAKIAGKGKNWKTVRHYRKDILQARAVLESKSKPRP